MEAVDCSQLTADHQIQPAGAKCGVAGAHTARRTNWQETTKASDGQGFGRNRATPDVVVLEVELARPEHAGTLQQRPFV